MLAASAFQTSSKEHLGGGAAFFKPPLEVGAGDFSV